MENRATRLLRYGLRQAVILVAALSMVGSQLPMTAFAEVAQEAQVASERANSDQGVTVTDSEAAATTDNTDTDLSENHPDADAAQQVQTDKQETDEKAAAAEDVPSAAKGEQEKQGASSDAEKMQDSQSAEEESAAASLLAASDEIDPESSRIYSSVDKLVPGTYSVLANISMRDPIPGMNLRAYATNPLNPESINGASGIPNVPVKTRNATLVVAADGTVTVVVTLPNPVFTFQKLGTSDGAKITNVTTKPIEKKDNDDDYNKKVADAGITTRIEHITFQLDNLSGTYHLTGNTEYATTLNKFLNKDLDLDLDLANAKKEVSGDFAKTFSDQATGVKLDVKAGASSSAINELSEATLSVASVTSGHAYEALKVSLGQKYKTVPDYALYTIDLMAQGAAIVPDDAVALTLKLSKQPAGSKVFRFAGNKLEEVGSVAADGTLSAPVSGLGSFVIATPKDEANTGEWAWTWDSLDAASGIGISYETDGTLDGPFTDLGTPEESVEIMKWYSGYFKLNTKILNDRGYTDQVQSLVSSESSFSSPQVKGLYSAGLTIPDFVPNANLFDPAGKFTFSDEHIVFAMTVPASQGSEFYLITGTKGSGATKAIKLKASVADGKAYVRLTKENTGTGNVTNYLFNSALDLDGGTMQPASDDTPWGYIAVVNDAPKQVVQPTAVKDLVYTGKAQIGVTAGEGYTVGGVASSTNAGSYKAIVTLKDGYVWKDGTNNPVIIDWSIAKAPLTAAFKNTTLNVGDELSTGLMDITGFVNGESIISVKLADTTFTLPTMSGGDTSQVGTYTVTPTGGTAKNYEFVGVPGVLTVKKPAASKELAPGTYRITANLSMPGKYNPLLPGTTVYPTNPNNPFGPVIDYNDQAEVSNDIPMTPVSMNATLVVAKDGTRTLVLPVKNPVFTLQELGTSSELKDISVTRVPPKDPANWKYGKYETRISQLTIKLTDDLTSGTKAYFFKGSKMYAVPLDQDIQPAGDVALQLDVAYSSAKKVSDSTTVPGGNGGSTNPGGNGGGSDHNNSGNAGGNQNNNQGNQGTSNNGGSTGGGGTATGHLKEGTYTVTANIYVSRASSGLPLSPHITSGVFPPKDPVTNNATLKVDANGRAVLYLPIKIQSRIMTVQSVNGLNVISSTGGNALTSVTIDLGVLENPGSTIKKGCSVTIAMGSLASTISGITGQHTWDATFELNLSGLPSSGGGSVPAGLLSKLQNADSNVTGVTTKEAEQAALEALEAEAAAAGEDGKNSPVQKLAGKSSGEKALETNPVAFAAGVVFAGALVGGGCVCGVNAYRRRKREAEQSSRTAEKTEA